MESTKEIFSKLQNICGNKNVLFYSLDISDYGKDETLSLQFSFDILVMPETADEVSAILKACNEYRIPVTPRGGGSGVSGGALPVKGGIVLSLENLNRIIDINEIDCYVVAEAGVITEDLCAAVEEKGLFFPVAPTSKHYSFIGGNVATNAGSIHSCKFGKTEDYVLNLEIVLPNGEIIWTGANVRKNSSGFDLTKLFVGSEGVFGIITKVVYRLLQKPESEILVLAGLNSLQNTLGALLALRSCKITLSTAEILCPNTLQLTAGFLKEKLPFVNTDVNYHLLLGFQSSTGMRETDLALVAETLEPFTDEELLVGLTSSEKHELTKFRRKVGDALVSNGMTYRDIDACVPFSALHKYIAKIEEIEIGRASCRERV